MNVSLDAVYPLLVTALTLCGARHFWNGLVPGCSRWHLHVLLCGVPAPLGYGSAGASLPGGAIEVAFAFLFFFLLATMRFG